MINGPSREQYEAWLLNLPLKQREQQPTVDPATGPTLDQIRMVTNGLFSRAAAAGRGTDANARRGSLSRGVQPVRSA